MLQHEIGLSSRTIIPPANGDVFGLGFLSAALVVAMPGVFLSPQIVSLSLAIMFDSKRDANLLARIYQEARAS